MNNNEMQKNEEDNKTKNDSSNKLNINSIEIHKNEENIQQTFETSNKLNINDNIIKKNEENIKHKNLLSNEKINQIEKLIKSKKNSKINLLNNDEKIDNNKKELKEKDNNNLYNIKNNNIISMNENNSNHLSEVINNEIYKKNIKNRTIMHFNKSKNKNPKIAIESKDKLDHKIFYNGKSFFSPIRTQTKNLFSFSNPKKKKRTKLKKLKKSNILYSMNRMPPIIDKEGLLMEILQLKNEIQIMDFELFKIKKRRKRLEQKFLANKLIIEGILDIQDEIEMADNINNNLANEQFINGNSINKLETQNIENKLSFIKSNNIFSQKTEENYYKHKINLNNNPTIISLKKQIMNCDKNIEDKKKLMDKKQNDNRVNNFLKLNTSIESKNKKLEELNNKSQALRYVILDIETRIEYFVVKTKNYIDDTNKLNDLLNNHNSKTIKNEKEMQSLILEKEEILKKIKLLEDGEKKFFLGKENKKKEKENIENELKITENIIKEKNNNEKEIFELDKKEIILKRILEKNNLAINNLLNDNKYLKNKIEKYLNERENLIEKSKIPQKSRDKSKNLENEIKIAKKEFEENKSYINNHKKIKWQLNKKINELSKEFEKKNLENKRIEEELNDTKKKYKEQVPIEYRKMLQDENDGKEKENKEKKKDCLIF